MNRLSRVLLLASLCWTLPIASASASAVATIDRVTVHEGETLELSILTDDGDPDASPLQRDFDVLSRAKSSQVNIINGKMTRRNEWILTLMPKHAGTLEIPALRVGKHSTAPMRVHVAAGSTHSTAPNGEIFLDIDIKPQTLYVQQQAIYTIRLWRAVELTDGSLSEPQADKLNVQRLGDDVKYIASRGNTRYQVVERRYAVFPQISGDVSIAPIELTGKVVEQRNSGMWRNDPFGAFFSQPLVRAVHVRSNETKLHVIPIPKDIGASSWLPATRLTLSEAWSPQPPVFRVGEPVTRTVTIFAMGQQAAQLPELTLEIPDAKLYPDQARLENTNDNAGINGMREQKIAIVATQEGPLELPAIQVAWWDTTLNKLQYATLPARTMTVAPGATSTYAAPATPANIANGVTHVFSPGEVAATGWRNAAFGLAALWLATIILWLVSAQRGRFAQRVQEVRDARLSQPRRLRAEVLKIAQSNNAAATRDALLNWAAAQWKHAPRTLPALAARVNDPQFTATLSALENSLYAAQPQTWN
ncbi:MAG: BatD family protein, partial [Gammaproteobacteria bacterium]|nr:BatD family protein [Gammaproteobacteria bacterium]